MPHYICDVTFVGEQVGVSQAAEKWSIGATRVARRHTIHLQNCNEQFEQSTVEMNLLRTVSQQYLFKKKLPAASHLKRVNTVSTLGHTGEANIHSGGHGR